MMEHDVRQCECEGGNSVGGAHKKAGSSPTVSTDGLIITTAIYAHKGRDVVTLDIPGAFLHTTNDEHIIMLLKGKAVELLVKL